MIDFLTFADDVLILSPVNNGKDKERRQAKDNNGCQYGNTEADGLVLGAAVPHEAMDRGPFGKPGSPTTEGRGCIVCLLFKSKGKRMIHLLHLNNKNVMGWWITGQ